MAEEKITEEPKLIRDLTGGGVLDNQKLDRIEQNPFIINDGVLPPPELRVTRSHLNTFEKKRKKHSKKKSVKIEENVEFENEESNNIDMKVEINDNTLTNEERNNKDNENNKNNSNHVSQVNVKQTLDISMDKTDNDKENEKKIEINDTMIIGNGDNNMINGDVEIQEKDLQSNDQNKGYSSSNENSSNNGYGQRLCLFGAILFAVIIAAYIYRRRVKKEIEKKLK
eukprot:240154_1